MMPAQKLSIFDIIRGRVNTPTIVIQLEQGQVAEAQERSMALLEAFNMQTEIILRSKN